MITKKYERVLVANAMVSVIKVLQKEIRPAEKKEQELYATALLPAKVPRIMPLTKKTKE